MTDHTDRRTISDESFMRKTKRLFGEILENAMLLYLIMRGKNCPAGVKIAIAAALGYLLLPTDAIPDPLLFGYTDDLAILSALLAGLECYITPELREEVRKKRMFK